MRTLVWWKQYVGHLQVWPVDNGGSFHFVAARFRVKQPPATTGLRVLYNPGPVSFHSKRNTSQVVSCLTFWWIKQGGHVLCRWLQVCTLSWRFSCLPCVQLSWVEPNWTGSPFRTSSTSTLKQTSYTFLSLLISFKYWKWTCEPRTKTVSMMCVSKMSLIRNFSN